MNYNEMITSFYMSRALADTEKLQRLQKSYPLFYEQALPYAYVVPGLTLCTLAVKYNTDLGAQASLLDPDTMFKVTRWVEYYLENKSEIPRALLSPPAPLNNVEAQLFKELLQNILEDKPLFKKV